MMDRALAIGQDTGDKGGHSKAEPKERSKGGDKGRCGNGATSGMMSSQSLNSSADSIGGNDKRKRSLGGGGREHVRERNQQRQRISTRPRKGWGRQ